MLHSATDLAAEPAVMKPAPVPTNTESRPPQLLVAEAATDPYDAESERSRSSRSARARLPSQYGKVGRKGQSIDPDALILRRGVC